MKVYFTLNDKDEPMVYRENTSSILRFVMPEVTNVMLLLDDAVARVHPNAGLRVIIYYNHELLDLAVLYLKIAMNKGAYDVRLVPHTPG